MTLPLILDILFVVIAVIVVAVHAKRGFIKSLISSCKLLLAFALAYLLGGQVAGLFQSNLIGPPIHDWVYDKVDGIYEGIGNSLNVEDIAAQFPEFLMTDEVRDTIANVTSEESGEAMVESITTGIADPVSWLISNIIGYLLTFVVSLIVLSLLAMLLNAVVDHIPLIGALNHVLGGLWGALLGLVLLFVAASIVKVFLSADDYAASTVVRFFGDSAVLEVMQFLNVGSAWFAQLNS